MACATASGTGPGFRISIVFIEGEVVALDPTGENRTCKALTGRPRTSGLRDRLGSDSSRNAEVAVCAHLRGAIAISRRIRRRPSGQTVNIAVVHAEGRGNQDCVVNLLIGGAQAPRAFHVLGTVAEIADPAELTVNVAGAPLNVTLVAPVRLFPRISTVLPTLPERV